MAYLSGSQISFGFREQSSGYTTVAARGSVTDWTFIQVLDVVLPEFARKLETVPKGPTGSRMSAPAPLAGSRDGGSVTFKMFLSGMPSGYDVTSDSPSISIGNAEWNPAAYFLNDFFGTSTVGTYEATPFETSLSDANTWTASAAHGNWSLSNGCMYGIANGSTTTIDALGWISTQSTVTAGLLQDTVVGSADLSAYNLFHGLTLSPAAGIAPTPKTFRIVNNTDEDLLLVGGFPQRCLLTLNAGSVPTAEFTYVFSWQALDASSFALQAPYAAQIIPSIHDKNNGRAWLGGAQLSDGTASSDETCGIDQLTVEIVHDIEPIRCHGAGSGTFQDVADRIVVDTEVNVSATVVHGDTFQSNATDLDWDTWLETPTARSLSVEVGTAPGNAFGIVMPAMYQQAQATLTPVGQNLIAVQTQWSPGVWTSDDSGAAGDAPIRAAFL